jgi:hypothetical protein
MEPNTNGNGFYMPVAPIGYGGYGMPYGGGYGGGLFGGNGDIWGLLFILAVCGGWGFGGFGGGLGMMGGMFGMDMLYPWLNNSQNINSGFRDQQLSTQVGNIQNAITSGFGDVQLGIADVNQNICQTGNSITAAVSNGFANAETAANARQIANMQQAFAAQTATSAGLNAVQGQIAQASSNNQLATESLRATVLAENCQDRYEAQNNTRDIITAGNSDTQAILGAIRALDTRLDRDKLDEKNDTIAQLRQELLYSRGQASQTAQNAFISQAISNGNESLYRRFYECPVGTTPVYGNQPIFTCPNNGNNCNCGGNVNLY